MSPAHQATPLPPTLGIPESDWQQTPTTVQDEFLSLLKRVDALESRLNRDSSNSSRPPSTDSAAKKRERRTTTTERRKPGGKPGHPGHRQTLLEPTTTLSLLPEPCGCGHCGITNLTAYHTHQVIELPENSPRSDPLAVAPRPVRCVWQDAQSLPAAGSDHWFWTALDRVRRRDVWDRLRQSQCSARPVCLGLQYSPE